MSESTDKYKKRKDIHNHTIVNISCYITKTENWTALEPFLNMWLKVHDVKLPSEPFRCAVCGAKCVHIVGKHQYHLFSNFFFFPNWNSAHIAHWLRLPAPSPLEATMVWTWLLQAPCVKGMTQYLPFSDWLSSLGIIPLRFIHVVTCVRISFLVTGI